MINPANNTVADIRQNRIFSFYFISLFIMSLCVSAVTYFTNISMVQYSVEVLGTTLPLAGTIAGAANFGSFIITFACGMLSNHVNKKILVRTAALLYTVATLGYATFRNPMIVICFRIIAGFAAGINFTSAMVLVTEVLPKDKITEGVGYYGLASTLMQSFGPMLALIIIRRWGYNINFITAGSLALVGFLCSFVLPDSIPHHDAKASKTTLSKVLGEVVCKESWLPACVGFVFALINGMQQALILSYSKVIGSEAYTGTYFLVISVMMIISRIILGKFIQSKTVAFAVTFSGIFLVGTTLFLGLGSITATMLIGAGLFGIGYGTLLPVTQSMSVKLAPEGRKGSGSSTYHMGTTSAFFIAPVFGSFLADPNGMNLGFNNAFLMLSVPCVIGIALACWKGRFLINQK